jgi:aminoglycoside phosphotransferase (APT) family kinase protein
MKDIANTDLPRELKIDSLERNLNGETNDVFLCTGEFDGRPTSAYIKISKHPQLSLSNECDVLSALQDTGLPVPVVFWYGGKRNDVMIVEAMTGRMIWDYIDPRRGPYDGGKALEYLYSYGECLARIHALAMSWPPQKRSQLHGLIGEEAVADERFNSLVSWVTASDAMSPERVFVHGDFNTASVLFDNNAISGIVDWEFAGTGWREYDLAWALPARMSFLNKKPERDAILDGYRAHASYSETALRFCEVLNYLHFAYWTRKTEPVYASFALDRAMDVAGLT